MKKLLYILLLAIPLCINSQINSFDSIKSVNKTRIKNDLLKITQTPKSRNYQNIETLNDVANYIKTELGKVCDTVAFQSFW